MEKIKSKLEDHNIYLTEADYSKESVSSISVGDLTTNLKLYSLLGKHVVLAAAHVFESKETFNMIKENPLLIESSMLVVDLRDDCRDFKDFLDFQREKKHDDELWQSKVVKDIARLLDSKCSRVLHWSPKKEEQIFKDLLIESLSNRESTLRKRLNGIRNQTINEFRSRIIDCPRLTRSKIDGLIMELIPNRRKVLMEEVNAAYYLSGAKDMNLVPALHPDYFHKCNNGLEHIKKNRQCKKHLGDTFSNIMQLRGLDRRSVEKLSIESVNKLRKNEMINGFRVKWWNIMEMARDYDAIKSFVEYEDCVNEIIYNELCREQRVKMKFNRMKNVAGIASLCVSGLSLIPFPLLSAISFLFSIATYSSITDNIEKVTTNQNLSILSTNINYQLVSQNLNNIKY